jgi:hypothetical protein
MRDLITGKAIKFRNTCDNLALDSRNTNAVDSFCFSPGHRLDLAQLTVVGHSPEPIIVDHDFETLHHLH